MEGLLEALHRTSAASTGQEGRLRSLAGNVFTQWSTIREGSVSEGVCMCVGVCILAAYCTHHNINRDQLGATYRNDE